MNTDLAEAVKEAQEALEQHDIAVAGDEWSFAPISLTVADALRSLLAATEPAPEPVSNAYTLPEEVREAAEDLFHAFGDVVPLYRHKSGSLHRPDEARPYGRLVAELTDDEGLTGAGADMVEFALLALRAALASRGGRP